MGAIFLSYAREDRGCAGALARVLESAGHDVWWDRRLDSGEEFGAEIEAALDASDAVVVAWSKESIKSRWVRDEAAVGGDRGCLVPVSIDGSLPPMGFRQFHTLDLTGWKGAKSDGRTAELLRSVERRAGAQDEVAPTVPISQPKRNFAFSAGRPVWTVVAMLVLLIAAGTAYFLTSRGPMRGPPPKPTIALLPFTASSSDPALRDIATQARDSISDTLSQTGIPVRLINSAPQDRASAGDFLISGELNRSAGKVVATVRLDEALHGVTVSTTRFEAGGDDVRNLAERIGVQTAGFFNGATLLILDRRHPLDPSLMAELFAEKGDFLAKYQIMKRVAANAPDEANTQIGLAFFTGFALPEIPRDERPAAVAAGRRAAEKALELAPDVGDLYATWCLLHDGTLLAECEDHLRKGNRLGDPSFLNGFLADMLKGVGRFEEAAEASRLSYTHDQYDFFKISQMLRTLEFTRDGEGARELYQQAIRWYPNNKFRFFRNRLFGLIYIGDFDAMQRLEQEVGSDVLPAQYPKSAAIVAALKSKSQPALRKACPTSDELLLTLRCLIAFATIGDEDSAYAVADQFYPNQIGRTPAETERMWLNDPEAAGPTDYITSPAAAPMRRDPRYLQLAQRTGLLDYWRSARAPDFCRKNPERICRQLMHRA